MDCGDVSSVAKSNIASYCSEKLRFCKWLLCYLREELWLRIKAQISLNPRKLHCQIYFRVNSINLQNQIIWIQRFQAVWLIPIPRFSMEYFTYFDLFLTCSFRSLNGAPIITVSEFTHLAIGHSLLLNLFQYQSLL